jgi:hypothetical protein
VLIPVLLAAFNFFEIKVQAMSVPRMATGKPKAKKKDVTKPLNLAVYITDRAFVLDLQKEHKGVVPQFGDTVVIPKREYEVGGRIQLAGGEDAESYYGKEKRMITEYDFPTLHRWLVTIKKVVWDLKKVNFPKEPRTVNLSAQPDIPWHIVARAIDACRVRLERDDFGGEPDALEQYSQAKPKKRPRLNKETNQPMEKENGDPVMEDTPLFDAVVFTVPRAG